MEDETLNKGGYRDEKGRFIKGVAPGRPVGAKNYTTLLEEAIKKYETKTGKQLFDRLIQRAFINDNVLLNVIKKFVPDKTQTELITPEPIKFIVERATGQPLENTDDNKENTGNENI
jgi:hypothetical protein